MTEVAAAEVEEDEVITAEEAVIIQFDIVWGDVDMVSEGGTLMVEAFVGFC